MKKGHVPRVAARGYSQKLMAIAFPFREIGPAESTLEIAGRILLLDCHGQMEDVFSTELNAQKFSILTPSNLEAAVQYLSGASVSSGKMIDLILIPVGENSGQLLSWVEQLRMARDQTPIMLLINADQVPLAMQAVQAGAYDYLIQPFSPQQGMAAVRRAVEYRRLRVQNDIYLHHLEEVISVRTEALQHTMQQLERSYDVTLEALGDALDLKDAETQGHSKRVTAYTLALGRAVGLNGSELRTVGRGAFLHDIGKMAIPDAILRKPGKLTAAEQAVMRTHSELGYQMLRKIPFLREAAEIVYSHQECYDGSGYPRGLRGEQIHIGARIFALADTLDAMTSNRPYRKANTIASARREVLRCAGTQFDPAIVDVFVATPDAIWQNLREGIMREGTAFSPFSYTFDNVT